MYMTDYDVGGWFIDAFHYLGWPLALVVVAAIVCRTLYAIAKLQSPSIDEHNANLAQQLRDFDERVAAGQDR